MRTRTKKITSYLIIYKKITKFHKNFKIEKNLPLQLEIKIVGVKIVYIHKNYVIVTKIVICHIKEFLITLMDKLIFLPLMEFNRLYYYINSLDDYLHMDKFILSN